MSGEDKMSLFCGLTGDREPDKLQVVRSRVVWAVLAALLFSATSFGVSITFCVKLSAPLKSGQFTEVQTDRTGLDDLPMVMDENDPTIWRATFDFEPTRYLLYRFRLSLGTGTTLHWEAEGDPGRVVFMTNEVIVLPLATYNVLEDSFQNTVTFRIDMREAIANGQFDAAVEWIGLSGALADDNPYFRVTFTNSPLMAGVYQATVPILTALPGEKVTYNYTTPQLTEGIAPRSFVLEGGAQVLPFDYFDNLRAPPVTGSSDGRLSIKRAPEESVTITWKEAVGVHLQRADALAGPFSTVNGTEGIGSVTLRATDALSFFRLATDF